MKKATVQKAFWKFVLTICEAGKPDQMGYYKSETFAIEAAKTEGVAPSNIRLLPPSRF